MWCICAYLVQYPKSFSAYTSFLLFNILCRVGIWMNANAIAVGVASRCIWVRAGAISGRNEYKEHGCKGHLMRLESWEAALAASVCAYATANAQPRRRTRPRNRPLTATLGHRSLALGRRRRAHRHQQKRSHKLTRKIRLFKRAGFHTLSLSLIILIVRASLETSEHGRRTLVSLSTELTTRLLYRSRRIWDQSLSQ